jgi:type IV pilus assembly protein PilM
LVVKQLPREGAGQIVALVEVGASATKVTITRDDQQLYSREQAFGGSHLTDEIMRVYGMGPDEAESLKRSGTPPDNYEAEILHPFIESMAQEVARAMQFFFTSTPHGELHHIVLAGGAVLAPGVAEIVGQRTNVHTILADPFAGMSISPRIRAKQLAADAPSLMVACGLALRKFD